MDKLIVALFIFVLIILAIVAIVYIIAFMVGALVIGLPSAGTGVGALFILQGVSRKLYEKGSTTISDFAFLSSIPLGAAVGAGVGFLTFGAIDSQATDSQWGTAVMIGGFAASGVSFVAGAIYASRLHFRKLDKIVKQYQHTPQQLESETPEAETLAVLQDDCSTEAHVIDFDEFHQAWQGKLQNNQSEETLVIRKLMCPYCLAQDTIAPRNGANSRQGFGCMGCSSVVPLEYVNSPKIPRVVVSAVGFRGHGKSVYFASLFHSLDLLANLWPKFYPFAIDEESLRTVMRNVKSLEEGQLPDRTPMSFPQPTIVKFSYIPGVGDRFFLFYDAGGEAYEHPSNLIQHARFVTRSRTAMFLVSLDDLKNDGRSNHELLSIYVQGLGELGGSTTGQHLVVVLSKGDRLEPRFTNYPDVLQYHTQGSLEQLRGGNLKAYTQGMRGISKRLRGFLLEEVKAGQFVNFAEDRFKSVDYCLVSALGAEPVGDQLQEAVTPKRILDPLLWIMSKS